MSTINTLDATMRRAAFTILWATIATGALTTGAQAQSTGGEDHVRRDTLMVRAKVNAMESVRIRARIESLLSKYNVEQLTSSDRMQLNATIDSLTTMLADLMRKSDEMGVGLAEGMSRGFGMGGGPRPARAPRRIEIIRGDLSPDDFVLKGWIGINAEGLTAPPRIRDGEVFLQYLEYPKVVTVDANSPAARAGILKGDVLTAYDGSDLREHEINLTRLLQPLHKVSVSVNRDGERHDYPLVVAKAPPSLLARRLESGVVQLPEDSALLPPRAYAGARRGGPGAGGRVGTTLTPMARGRVYVTPTPGDSTAPMPAEPRMFVFRNFGDALVGAKMEVVDAELGETFGLDAGVLLTHVGESGPARSSGLRSGDVIVRANGEDITSVAQLRRIVAGAGDDRRVELRVVRQKKPMTIMLRW